jgi:CBS domain-containing protein
MKIGSIVNSSVNTIFVEDTVQKALEIMTGMNINGMLVVDHENKLVGMIVKADIYRFLIQPGHIDSCPVDWVMSKQVITAEADDDILLVAKRLRDHDIVAMPVLENEEIVGIISIEDLLDYYISLNSKS